MTTPVGGLRARLIRDSFYNWVKDGVVARGWTDSDRRHTPFQFVPQPNDWDEQVPLNSIAVSTEDVTGDEAEMGSNLTDDTWTYYVDLYAENERVGMDCAHDVRDLLRGKMPSIGYMRPVVPVYDYREATPSIFAFCQVEDVVVDRARGFSQAWRRYWFSVRCSLVDSYDSDADPDLVYVPPDYVPLDEIDGGEI